MGNPRTPATLRGVDLEHATVLDLQRAMDEHRFSAAELTDFYLHRIAALDPLVNAVVETSRRALADARDSDEHRRQHGRRSPLEGIPVLLKDNIDTADGMLTTAGSLALLGSRPRQDAFHVRKLREAGAIILGKANLSEWANFRSTGSSSGWSARGGQTHNAHVLDRNPCGSSSGPAVATAANLATLTIGTETNGSIVCPASVNGVVGLKPSVGLVSRSGIIPISTQQDTAGPLTRNVTDAAAALSVIRGVDERDPATADAAPHAACDYLTALDPEGLAGKRIGVWRDPGAHDREVSGVLDASASALAGGGAVIVDDLEMPGSQEVLAAQLPALLVEFKHDLNAYLAATPGDHPSDLAGLIRFNLDHATEELPHFGQDLFERAEETLGDLSDPDYLVRRAAATDGARSAIDKAVAVHGLDAIVASTNHAVWRTDLHCGDDFTGLVSSATLAAVAGYPNLTVPAGFAKQALPLGVSFFGPRFNEPVLLAIAYAFEQATRVRRPPAFLPTLAG
jgi:amidase